MSGLYGNKLAPRGLEEAHCHKAPGTAHRLGLPVPQQELQVPLHENSPFSLEGTGMERQMDDPLDNTEMFIKTSL